MSHLLNHPWGSGVLLGLVLAAVLELGYRVSTNSLLLQDASREEQLATIRDWLFVLVSLLLGFTLALAGTRFAERRSLLVEDAVSISTSYLRAGTLPQPYRSHSQELFREYVDCRLALDNAGLNSTLFNEASNRSKRVQEELWSQAAAVTEKDRTAITAAYINSLNEMIDLHERRLAAFENRVPLSVWLLITSVAAIAAFTRGLTLTSRFWLNLVLIPATIAVVVALIGDLDTPSSGLIRLDQRAMQRLKADLSIGPSR